MFSQIYYFICLKFGIKQTNWQEHLRVIKRKIAMLSGVTIVLLQLSENYVNYMTSATISKKHEHQIMIDMLGNYTGKF